MKKFIGVMIAGVMLSGCAKLATKQDIATLQNDIQEVRMGVINVGNKTNKAYDLAKNANERIDTLTEVTATCCAENRARLDALFERAMQK